MLVEYIMAGEGRTTYHMANIPLHIIKQFKPFQVLEPTGLIPITNTNISVKIHSAQAGVEFLIKIGEEKARLAIGCFSASDAREQICYAKQVGKFHKIKYFKAPQSERWLMTLPFYCKNADLNEIRYAREIELYVYQALWLAWQKKDIPKHQASPKKYPQLGAAFRAKRRKYNRPIIARR